ncbi:hypothetical protein C8J56DRAFT_386239 [Mycena floridula]|nr:hypothetical protein C8J56DRAFT_386239 [Mycena floridula]
MQPGFTCSHCGHQDVVEEYESPLPSHLLETNDPPLGSEEQFLREMLDKSDFERGIVETDAKLASLELMVVALRRRREKMAESFITTKKVLSPIRRVPAEIIGEIFMLALTEEDGSVRATSLNMAEGPWAYGQVCRIWRKEIFSRPSIWANIYIYHGKDLDHRRYSADLLDAIIQRSQSRPLRLDVCLNSESDIAKAILAKAVEFSHRWQSVALYLTPRLFARLKKLKSRVPLLEVLCLIGHSANYNPISFKITADCFRDAPALRKCCNGDFHNYHLMNLPWTQLTHLDEHSLDPTEVLRRTPNLVSLALRSWLGISTQPRFCFEHLRTLDLLDCFLGSGLVWDLPALVELRIRVEDLVSVSLPTSASLRHLSLLQTQSASFEELAVFRSFIQPFHFLSILDLRCITDLPPFFLVLSDPDLVSSLQLLLLDGDLQTSLEPLVDMVQSRRAAASTFRQICFSSDNTSDKAALDPNITWCIETMREAGIEVSLDRQILDVFGGEWRR